LLLNLRGFGANLEVLATSIIPTGLIILGVVVGFGVGLCLAEPEAQVFVPFLDGGLIPKGETSFKPRKPNRYLRGVHDETLDRQAINYLPREGVEGELVVGVEAVEEGLGDCGFGCFSIDDIGSSIEGGDSVKMAAEEVCFSFRRGIRGLEAERKFYGWLSIRESNSFERVVFAKLLQIPHDGTDEGLAIFILVVGDPRALQPLIPGKF
jgi:hypothetical protein